MKLITELCEDLQFLHEEKEGKKRLYIEGPFVSTEVANRNNRIYSKSMMEPIIESYIQSKVDKKTAVGELGHPQGPKVNEDRVSHRIVSLKWSGNQVIGRAVVLPEGNGKIISGIIETGGRLGMSTRGMGSVKENNGLQEVQNDFKLVTVDAVLEPSGQDCWVNGIMEGVDWVYDATRGTYMENKLEDLQKAMKKLSVKQLNEKKLMLFEYYLQQASISAL